MKTERRVEEQGKRKGVRTKGKANAFLLVVRIRSSEGEIEGAVVLGVETSSAPLTNLPRVRHSGVDAVRMSGGMASHSASTAAPTEMVRDRFGENRLSTGVSDERRLVRCYQDLPMRSENVVLKSVRKLLSVFVLIVIGLSDEFL